jgi:uncharacterized repeat protein (TIGR01451 family)
LLTMNKVSRFFAKVFVAVAFLSGILAIPAIAATCGAATSQGFSGPAAWQSYCWVDMTSYNDTTARSASGQNFSINLSDGAILTFNLKTTTTAAVGNPALSAVASPSWTGAAFGNSSFIGIPNSPILYTATSGTTSTVTISSILITPPPGVPAVTAYSMVIADGESTAAALPQTEAIRLTTNGSGWVLLDSVDPISGTNFPTQTGLGSTVVDWVGNSGDPVGGYVIGTNSPTTISARLSPIGGKEGILFAVRFASLRLTKQITGARADPTDQFKFDINATASGTNLATGTTSGAGLGPFTAAAVSLASGIPITLTESMAPGSVSTASHYSAKLTCTNATPGSSTPLPSNLATTSYNFGALQFGDAVICTYVNTPFPHLTLRKALGAGGRQFSADQFIVNIAQGTTNIANNGAGTTGATTTITNGTTPQVQVNAATAYAFSEAGVGATSLLQYTAVLSCTNAATSSTVLPAAVGGSITPQMGDVVTCTITNTKNPSNANLSVIKASTVLSDSVSASNPKALPGAIVRYSLTVSNTGAQTVTNNSIFMIDQLPGNIAVGSAATPTFTNGTPSSALTFSAATDIRYSNQATAPTNFAACSAAPHNYTPVSAYDLAVKFICINPKGTMAGSTGTPPSFTITFQAQLN